MKEYRVYFSFYSEQYGDFEETMLKVEAENQFEARRLAWEMSDKTDEFKFASNVRVCGIDWNASPLDMEDYFNAAASYEKYRLNYIENVELPNARISKNEQSRDYYERQKYEHYGSIGAIFSMAMVFGKPLGMKPPTICEELHYTREFLNLIYDDYDKYSAFLKKIEKAEKWDSSAMYDIRDSFKYGRFRAEGYEYDFSQQYGKDGLYPNRANLTDSDFTYVYRWENQREHKHMAYLPFFGEKDIIAGSQEMQYDYQTLVLKKDLLQPEYQTPINSLWIANQGGEVNFDTDGNKPIVCENPFTGENVEWKRSDFLGVLRPEINAKIDYEAIKTEYQALDTEYKKFDNEYKALGAENGAEHEDTDEEMEA